MEPICRRNKAECFFFLNPHLACLLPHAPRLLCLLPACLLAHARPTRALAAARASPGLLAAARRLASFSPPAGSASKAAPPPPASPLPLASKSNRGAKRSTNRQIEVASWRIEVLTVESK